MNTDLKYGSYHVNHSLIINLRFMEDGKVVSIVDENTKLKIDLEFFEE